MESETLLTVGAAAELVTIEHAARVLGGISVWTLRKHIARGAIAVTRIGRRVLVPRHELARISREGLPCLRHREEEVVDAAR
jgi:excisionase family DNA binding protein